MRKFDDLSEREILALAISNEEEDARIFADFADGLHDDYPASAKVFDEMAAEENGHRRRLIDLFVSKFGDHISLVRRDHIRGYIPLKPVWHQRPLGIEAVRAHAREMERTAARFYRRALTRTTDASTRKLLGDLAEEEEKHDQIAARARGANPDHLCPQQRRREPTPALHFADHPARPGWPDGRLGSTLAPVFAAAFATHSSWNAFLVGLAASIGAGISMGFAEALRTTASFRAVARRSCAARLRTDDHGGRHRPHAALPYPLFLYGDVIALVVVIIELSVIAWIQWRYMDTPPLSAAAKVMIGGALVLAAGILIGSSWRTRAGLTTGATPVNGTNGMIAPP